VGIWKTAFAIVRVATLFAEIFVTLPLDARKVFITVLLRDKMLIKT